MEQARDMKSALDKSLQLEEILVSEKVTKLKKRRLRRKKLEAFRKQASAVWEAYDWEDCRSFTSFPSTKKIPWSKPVM